MLLLAMPVASWWFMFKPADAEMVVKQEAMGLDVCVIFFAFFTHAITPPFAAHWSDTGPRFGSEIKNRASVSTFPFPPQSRF